jgi:hypothetical protein
LEELLANENKVQAWPNPADEFMQIEYDLLFSKPNAYIRIMDMHGRVIETWNISDTQIGLKLLDTRKLTSGIYFYEISQEGKRVKSDKIIIQH